MAYLAFRLQNKMIAGFGAFKDHLSYFPHSGSVLETLKDDLVGYSRTKALFTSATTPLPPISRRETRHHPDPTSLCRFVKLELVFYHLSRAQASMLFHPR